MDEGTAATILAADAGDAAAIQREFSLLYRELKARARRAIARAGGQDAPLGASSLLHQAYETMAARAPQLPDRARFMAYASRVMRGLVIDHVRSRRARKRGGLIELTTLKPEEVRNSPALDAQQLEQLGAAIDQLAAVEPELSRLVDLKFFGGFSFQEIAAMEGISERTAMRRWNRARVFLHRALKSCPLG